MHALEQRVPDNTKTRVAIVSRAIRNEERTYLKEDARIRFAIGDREIEVKLGEDGQFVELYGEEALAIWPHVSNVVRVTLQR